MGTGKPGKLRVCGKITIKSYKLRKVHHQLGLKSDSKVAQPKSIQEDSGLGGHCSGDFVPRWAEGQDFSMGKTTGFWMDLKWIELRT